MAVQLEIRVVSVDGLEGTAGGRGARGRLPRGSPAYLDLQSAYETDGRLAGVAVGFAKAAAG